MIIRTAWYRFIWYASLGPNHKRTAFPTRCAAIGRANNSNIVMVHYFAMTLNMRNEFYYFAMTGHVFSGMTVKIIGHHSTRNYIVWPFPPYFSVHATISVDYSYAYCFAVFAANNVCIHKCRYMC